MLNYFFAIFLELNGKSLIFVIKLDEAKMIHSQKQKKVSLTLMSHTLDRAIELNSEKYFLVQSKHEIWSIALFLEKVIKYFHGYSLKLRFLQ